MGGVSKITHKGKEIIYVDYRECKDEVEMIEVIQAASDLISHERKENLQLANMTGAFVTAGFMKEAKKIVKSTPKLAKKRAIVGIESAGRLFLLKVYNMVIGSNDAVKPFRTIEEAKDWLVA